MGRWDQRDRKGEDLEAREDQEVLEGQVDQVVEDPSGMTVDREDEEVDTSDLTGRVVVDLTQEGVG